MQTGVLELFFLVFRGEHVEIACLPVVCEPGHSRIRMQLREMCRLCAVWKFMHSEHHINFHITQVDSGIYMWDKGKGKTE